MTQFIEMIANVLILVFFFRMSCAEENLTFNRFQLKFNKTYESNTVLNLHKQTFNNNLAKIEEHNKKFQQGLVSYKMEPNQFADLSEAEFSSRLRTWPLNKTLLTNVKEQDISEVNFDDLPKNVDWRDKGIVTSVKNQGNCGSCWAFSTTGLFEGQLALVNGNLTSLSEQQLLDCSTSGGYGCDGGVIQSALNYVAKYGLTTENAYPYQGRQGSCEKNKPVAVSARGYVSISDNETNLKIAVATQGPVSVAVNADLLQFYSGGIFNTSCSTIVDHAVLVVGYGTIGATGAQYWIIKNSWGTAWGENGYYRMAMGVGNGLCGIASQAFYPYGVSNSVESRSNVGSILWQNKVISLLALFAIIISNIL